MDINSKTQLINTFSKGMDTDTSDALLSNESYRFAENLRFVTEADENTGELHLIPGAKTLSFNFKFEDLGGNEYKFTDVIVLATNSINNYGVIIVKDPDDGSWAVVRVTNNKLPDDTYKLEDTQFVFGWCHEQLGEKLSTVLNYESEGNIKLYIADGKHQIMIINIMSDTVYNTIANITNSATISLLPPYIDQIISGSLKPALIQYAYMYYDTHGLSSNLSPLSSLNKVNSIYEDIIHGVPYDKKSEVGFRVLFDHVGDFSKVRLYRISYLQVGQLPTIDVIYDGKYNILSINGTPSVIIDDTGQEPLSTLTIQEFNSLSGVELIPNVIEQKNNILFAANITYAKSKYAESFEQWDARSFVVNDKFMDSDGKPLNVLDNDQHVKLYVEDNQQIEIYNDLLDLLKVYNSAEWKCVQNSSTVIGGIGINIDYQIITDDDHLIDSNIDADIFIDAIERHSINSIRYKSLRRDEIYRYGIILYAEDGYKSPVKWIADIRTPDANTIPIFVKKPDNRVYSKILGIKFRIENLPTGCEGYEIVRCEMTLNDRATICQGVVSSLYSINVSRDDTYHEDLLIPTGYSFLTNIGSRETIDGSLIYSTDKEFILFFSPEISYQPDDIKQIFSTYNSLRIYPIQRVGPDIHEIVNLLGVSLDTPGFVHTNDHTGANKYPDAFSIVSGSYFSLVRPILGFDVGIGVYSQDKEDGIYDDLLPSTVHTLGRSRERITCIKFYNTLNYNSTTYPQLNRISNYAISSNIPQFDEVIIGKNDNIRIAALDKSVTIESKVYTPISMPCIFNVEESEILDRLGGANDVAPTYPVCGQPIGISDRCAVFKLLKFDDHTIIDSFINRTTNLFDTLVVNIRKIVTPYGGFTMNARNNSKYIGHGYFSGDATVINVYDGDCFIDCFEYVPMHLWYHPTLVHHCNGTVICSVPLETSIDIMNDHGSRFSKQRTANRQLLLDQPVDFVHWYTQSKPLYAYNTAYSMDSNVSTYVSEQEDEVDSVSFRVHYSNPKEFNEEIDSWSIFLPLNYIDVDSKYGDITELRTFKNQLVFWQQNAFGVLSVNERVLMSTDSNLPLILGTGGILDRYDYITTKYGMREKQFADTQSDSALYWWDYTRNEILSYSGNLLTPLSIVKKVLNHINYLKLDKNRRPDPVLVYDKFNNEILFDLFSEWGEYDAYRPTKNHKYGPIVYNESIAQFISRYSIRIEQYLSFPSAIYFIERSDLYDQSGKEITYFNLWNVNHSPHLSLYSEDSLYPYIKYVINSNPTITKVYDKSEFGGRFYGGGEFDNTDGYNKLDTLPQLNFIFKTPLKQEGRLNGKDITNREYDFRFAIPRCGYEDDGEWITKEYGDRLRGKTMQCEMSSTSNSTDFSLQYIITKYRISWS